MNDQRTSYGTEDSHSSVQQICVYTVIVFIVRKTGLICQVLVGLTAGWQADKTGMSYKIFKILYKLLLCLIAVQCYYSVSNAYCLVFSSKAYLKLYFNA